MTNTLQQRWALLTQADNLVTHDLHKLERIILESSIRMKNVNICVWGHPAVQDFVDRCYAQIQPFWDRQLMVTERMQRWDEFVKDLYRNKLHEWEELDKEEARFTDVTDTREAFARRMLERLHNADVKVRMNIKLTRSLEAKEDSDRWKKKTE